MTLSLGVTSPAVSRLQNWLTFLSVNAPDIFELDAILPVGYLYDAATQAGVKRFQKLFGLTADGVFGQQTFNKLREQMHLFYAQRMGVSKLQKHVVPADKYGGGYDIFRLRTDAAFWYELLIEDAHKQGIILPSSGSDRSISAQVTAARSKLSMHYIAIAFDMFIYAAMMHPESDPFVVEKDGDYWRVWARTDKGVQRTIANPVTYAKRNGTGKPVTGTFIDFTQLASKYHFQRIRPRKSFFTDMSATAQMGAEWWHFQNEFLLMPEFSTFGQELLTLYTQSEIDASPLRGQIGAVFGEVWN